MNVLFIGLDDSATVIPMLQETIEEPTDCFYTNDITQVPFLIDRYKINLFLCDLKFPTEQVTQLIDTIDSPHNRDVRGVFIHDEVNNKVSIQGINSYVVKDHILRPYDEDRIVEMWVRCISDLQYKYHAIVV